MDIFLVRHGEAAASWGQSKDPGLSELGVKQAEEASRLLLPLLDPGPRIVSSPLARARETAAPLAQALGQGIRIDDAFREVPAPVPLEQRKAWLQQFMQQTWNTQPQDLLEWRERCIQQLLECTEPTIVFTHFLVLNAVAGKLMGRDEILSFYPDNGSVTHLRHTGDALELVQLGREMQTVIN